MIRTVLAVLALALAGTAQAAERSYTITGFDRIRVEGPYTVTVTSNRGPSARASGSPAALDELVVRVDGRTLMVRRGASGWSRNADLGPVSVAVTVPGLVAASLTGSGTLVIDTMRAGRIDLVVDGSGRLRLASVETDRLGATVVGSGAIALTGKAAEARVAVRGSGAVEGEALSVGDAVVGSDGSGSVRLTARRTASVQASGSGTILIEGAPACTVRNVGAGEVRCGGKR